MPRSSTARFSEMWQRSTGDDLLLEHIVEKWRLSASGGGTQASLFSEALEAASTISEAGYSDDGAAAVQFAARGIEADVVDEMQRHLDGDVRRRPAVPEDRPRFHDRHSCNHGNARPNPRCIL